MERICCVCNTIQLSCGLFHKDSHDYFCNQCFQQLFKMNVIVECPSCKTTLKVTDFYKVTPDLYKLTETEIHTKIAQIFSSQQLINDAEFSQFVSEMSGSIHNSYNLSQSSTNSHLTKPNPAYIEDSSSFYLDIVKEMPDCLNLDSVSIN